jgi:hypothetical protein
MPGYRWPSNAEDANFSIWSPWAETLGGGKTVVTFDVTSTKIDDLNEGTREAMDGFARQLAPNCGRVVTWDIERFFTPYYSFTPDAPKWSDRIAEAWQVSVTLEGAEMESGFLGLGPFGADSWDATAVELPPFEESPTVRCVVLADSDEDPSSASEPTVDGLPSDVAVTTVAPRGMPFKQYRFDLGVRSLPADIEIVESVVASVRRAGYRTVWSDQSG